MGGFATPLSATRRSGSTVECRPTTAESGDGRRVTDTIEVEQLVIRRHTVTIPYGELVAGGLS